MGLVYIHGVRSEKFVVSSLDVYDIGEEKIGYCQAAKGMGHMVRVRRGSRRSF